MERLGGILDQRSTSDDVGMSSGVGSVRNVAETELFFVVSVVCLPPS